MQLRRILRLEELLESPEPYAILALPASGTSWMCRALYEAGRPCHHEHYAPDRFRKKDRDLMSFKFNDKDIANKTYRFGDHAPERQPFPRYAAFYYHTRNPLRQVYSMACLDRGSTIRRASEVCGAKEHPDTLVWCMRIYTAFHYRAAALADAWYRVEDMKWSLPHMTKHNKDKTPKWDELYSLDRVAAAELKLVSVELGHE
jgi:hypothetical protein